MGKNSNRWMFKDSEILDHFVNMLKNHECCISPKQTIFIEKVFSEHVFWLKFIKIHITPPLWKKCFSRRNPP